MVFCFLKEINIPKYQIRTSNLIYKLISETKIIVEIVSLKEAHGHDINSPEFIQSAIILV